MYFNESNRSIINSSFNITYLRKPQVKEKIQNKIEGINKLFEDLYLPPEIIDVPYSIEPEIPRAVFNAINGHSQITFSQIMANINAKFDKRYQGNFELCKEYIKSRTEKTLDILRMADIKTIYYMGLSGTLQFKQDSNEEEIINHIMLKLNKSVQHESKIYDVNNKYTFVINDKYFVNITIGNYRNFNIGGIQSGSIATTSFVDATLLDKGIFINFDINSRYDFNTNGNKLNDTDIEETKEWLYSFAEEFVYHKVFKILNEGAFDL